MSLLDSAKQWARHIKRDVVVVYFAARDPETPLLVRALAVMVAAYALSPIDLIPDFIPVLGYLDDLIIVPIGLIVVIRLLPPHVLESSRGEGCFSNRAPTEPDGCIGNSLYLDSLCRHVGILALQAVTDLTPFHRTSPRSLSRSLNRSVSNVQNSERDYSTNSLPVLCKPLPRWLPSNSQLSCTSPGDKTRRLLR